MVQSIPPAAAFICWQFRCTAKVSTSNTAARSISPPSLARGSPHSFVHRACYDRANAYMPIKLRGTYYHYCKIDAATVERLLAAESVGRFYDANIKGDGRDGPFDFRIRRVPAR